MSPRFNQALLELTDLVSARLGDVLTARCFEVSKSGRMGVYDVEVANQRGEVCTVAQHILKFLA